MLRRLIRFSLDHVSVVLTAALLLVSIALLRLPHMSVDVFPELNAPTVTIMTEAGGLAADEVEQFVSSPIESAVNGMAGVRRIRSASTIGLSIVWVDLAWGADLRGARQLVTERLSTVTEGLPTGAQPFITPMTSIAGEIMLVSLSSPNGERTALELRAYAEFELRDMILGVPGVAQAVAIGGDLPEYQVLVRQERLRALDLAFEDVAQAARSAHSTQSAGYLPDVAGRELPIRQASRVRGLDDIRWTPVHLEDGSAMSLGDVAEVQLGPALKRGTASENGKQAVVLSIQKSPGANTLALTDALDELFDQVEPALPAGMQLNRDVVRQSHFIDRAVNNVTSVLLEAVLIVLAVVALFLMNLRTTLITLTALPVSLAVGLLLMDGMGLGLNVMSLGGLAIAIGVLVDDAIIDVENVFRRLREHRAAGGADGRTLRDVIFDASNEIRPAMVFATVIIVAVFVPLLFLQGLEGRFFRPLALTYIVSILASLLVALTVTPALCQLLLRRRIASTHGSSESGGDGPLVRLLKCAYRPALAAALRMRGAVLILAALGVAGALAVASTFGTSFLPAFNEGTFTLFLMAPPGTSLEESNRLATQVETQLTELEGIAAVVRRTGRAERDEHAEPVSSSEIDVRLDPEASSKDVRRRIDALFANVPGITTMVGQPIEHRLSHVLSGTPAALAISLFGDDLGALRATAKRVESELEGIAGARDISANREVLVQSIPIEYGRRALADAGLSAASAAEQVGRAIYGEVVAEVHQGSRRYDLVVRLVPEERDSIEDLEALQLVGAGGARVRLGDVATVGTERTSNLITRENARRKAVVSLNVADGSNLGDLVASAKARVDPIASSAGLTVRYGGQFEAREAAARTIVISGLVVMVAMLMLLQASTGSLRAALLVMLNMPLALLGGVAAVFLTGDLPALENLLALVRQTPNFVPPILSIAGMVGFITLFGIAVRNGILLVGHFRHLSTAEGETLEGAITRGSMERLVPILMTAISAALGLLPMALAAGRPGGELLAPLAIVTLGGLVTSTLLNLIVIPAGYSLAFRGHVKKASQP